jgi:DNA replication and repair protein RecF
MSPSMPSAADLARPDLNAAAAPRIARLILKNFRSYAALDLAVTAPLVALTGENGAGKTNALEAISLFTPGRGLRRAELAEMARIGGAGNFAASIVLDESAGETHLGTGIDPAAFGEVAGRRCRIDHETVPSPTAFADHVRVVWLTPALDGLFSGPAGDRRRYLDRLVLAVDASHGGRVNAFERALRARNRLLEEPAPDRSWLDAVEREVAELGVAVAAARRETVDRLAALASAARDVESPFPWANLRLSGEVEELVGTLAALDVEDHFRALLRDGRARDRAAGRALAGPQTADLVVRHGPKDAEAAHCSTGEQKALLIGLVLAHARLVAAMSGIAPFVLLDEIAAHLDPRRRAALFGALVALGGQVWMTGADGALFGNLPDTAQRFLVTPGRIAPLP